MSKPIVSLFWFLQWVKYKSIFLVGNIKFFLKYNLINNENIGQLLLIFIVVQIDKNISSIYSSIKIRNVANIIIIYSPIPWCLDLLCVLCLCSLCSLYYVSIRVLSWYYYRSFSIYFSKLLCFYFYPLVFLSDTSFKKNLILIVIFDDRYIF